MKQTENISKQARYLNQKYRSLSLAENLYESDFIRMNTSSNSSKITNKRNVQSPDLRIVDGYRENVSEN